MKQTNRQVGRSFFSELSHGAKLWLGLILSFFCAVLVFCAFFVPSRNEKTAEAKEVDI